MVRAVEPDLLGARLGGGTVIDSLLYNLAHPIEPPAGAFHPLLAPHDRRAYLCVFNSEFHLLIKHNLPFYFSRNSKKGGGTFTVLPQLYFLCSWIRFSNQ